MNYWGNWGNWSDCKLSRVFGIESGMNHYTWSDFNHIYNRDLLKLSPRWTPDGGHIVFTTQSNRYSSDSRSQMQIISADGSSLLTIGEESGIIHSPIVSRDGSRIMYSSYNDVDEDKRYFEIVTAALDGSDRKRLSREVGFDVPSDWLYNDTRIAFTRDAESPCAHDFSDIGLYTMRPDGSDVRRVIPGKDWGISGRDILTGTVSWSPDRRTVALLVDENLPERDPSTAISRLRRTSLVTVDVHDSSMTRLVVGEESPLHSGTKPISFVGPLVWSPDGSRITFLRWQSPDYSLKLYSISRDGSDLREVVGPDADYARLGGRWVSRSPYFNGPQIMFSPSEPLYLVHVDGSEYRFADAGRHRAHTSSAPDGSRIAISVPHSFNAVLQLGSDVALLTSALDGSDARVLVRRGENGVLEAVGTERQRDGPFDIVPCSPRDPDCLQVVNGRLVFDNPCSGGFVAPDPEANAGLVQDCEALWELGRWAVEVRQPGYFEQPSWDGLTPISEWEGVVVGDTSTGLRVVGLSLKGWKLSGPISGRLATELAKLTALETLDLSYNELSDPVPPEFGNLPNLKRLNLSYNRLSGCIPEGLREKVHGYLSPKHCNE